MSDLDAFETRLAHAIQRYQAEIAADVDASSVVRAASETRRPVIQWPWAITSGRTLAWIALTGLLLAALAGAALLFGAQRLPITGACPAGTDPNKPGPAAQARPPQMYVQPMAFDSRAGRIVAWAVEEAYAGLAAAQTWTFDVCTNTWRQEHPTVVAPDIAQTLDDADAPGIRSMLVYDASAGLTLGIASDTHVWAYDFAANTWTRKGPSPFGWDDRLRLVYDPSSALVVAQPAAVDDVPLEGVPLEMWTYAVSSDTWSRIEATGAPDRYARPIMAFDGSTGLLVVYDGETRATWLFDPRTRIWSTSTSETPEMGFDWAVGGGEIAYDEATRQVVATSGGKVVAYDGRSDRWSTLLDPRANGAVGGPTLIGRPTVVYDAFNRRLVVYGSEYPVADGSGVTGWIGPSGVLAFDPATSTWTTLLAAEPLPPTLR